MLRCGSHVLDLSRPRVMGIVNVTPDSFSEGGRFEQADRAIGHARQLLADGADVIDVGGESTRPGAQPITIHDEIERVVPIVRAITQQWPESTRPGAAPVGADAQCARVVPVVSALAQGGAIVSVDTSNAVVMQAALSAGASMINDVRALREPGALAAIAVSDCAVCLMHMQGTPATMQDAPAYADVVHEVREFLQARADACRAAGITAERIVVDPGFGFGKTLAHNAALMHGLPEIAGLGYPVLAGLSRKGSLGAITGRPAGERLAASVAAALAAVARGASVVRVHDVRETVDALKVWMALT